MNHNTATLTDPILPQLATALNTVQMAQRFQDALGQNLPSIRVLDCRIERMKYKPGKSCLISYCLCLSEGDDGQNQQQLICARCYPVGESQRRFERANSAQLVATIWGTSLLHFPELSMVAWLFPNEPKLIGLPRLLNEAQLRTETLPALLQKLPDCPTTDDWQITAMNHTLVHYAPEHTCTVRMNATVQHCAQTHAFVFYGKTYDNDYGAETYRLMAELWSDCGRDTTQLILAQPLDYDPQHRILWQRGLAGQPLLAFESEKSDFVPYLRRAAVAVAALHHSGQRSKRNITEAQWLGKLSEMRSLLSQVRPECQPQIERIIKSLLAHSDVVKNAPVALLHGDLHLQNFLVHNDTISLIDMDNLVNGSPWQDIGSFAAGLYYRGILRSQPMVETKRLIASFCDAYADACHWQVSPAAIQWYTAAALINERAYRTVSRCKNGNLELVDALLNCAEGMIQA